MFHKLRVILLLFFSLMILISCTAGTAKQSGNIVKSIRYSE